MRTRLLRPAIDIENDNDLDRIVATFATRYQAAYETNPHELQLESIRSQLKRMGQ